MSGESARGASLPRPERGPRIGPGTLAAFWGSIAGAYSLLSMASGLNVKLSPAAVGAAVAFWSVLGGVAGLIARRRWRPWLDERAAYGWALAALAWASIESVFMALVVVKPTRWPPLGYSLLGIGVPAIVLAALALRALRRARTGARRRIHPALVVLACWTTLAVLLMYLPRWLRVVADSSRMGWFAWGLFDLAWLVLAAGTVVSVGAINLAVGRGRRRTIAVAAGLACLQLSPFLIPRDDREDGRPSSAPSIVWIMIDSLRADHASAYGYARPTTPNLERLAAEGTRVRSHVSTGVRTENTYVKMLSLAPSLDRYLDAAPTPLSRARLLVPTAWRPEQPGLVPALEEAGYDTAMVHLYDDLLEDSGLQPLLQPFDHVGRTRLSGDSSFGVYLARMILGNRLDGTPRMDRWAAHRRKDLAERMPETVEAYLAGRRDPDPLFMIVHLAGGHAPQYTFADSRPLADPRPGVAGRYDDALRAADDQLGELLASVRRHLPGAVVFVFADHGHKLAGEPLLPDHLVVPLVVSPPLAPAPTGVTSSLDLVPTTIALARGEAPRCDGRLARDLRCAAGPDEVRVVDHTGHGELTLVAILAGGLVAADVGIDGTQTGALGTGPITACDFFARTRFTDADLAISPIERRDGLATRLRRQLARCR